MAAAITDRIGFSDDPSSRENALQQPSLDWLPAYGQVVLPSQTLSPI